MEKPPQNAHESTDGLADTVIAKGCPLPFTPDWLTMKSAWSAVRKVGGPCAVNVNDWSVVCVVAGLPNTLAAWIVNVAVPAAIGAVPMRLPVPSWLSANVRPL